MRARARVVSMALALLVGAACSDRGSGASPTPAQEHTNGDRSATAQTGDLAVFALGYRPAAGTPAPAIAAAQEHARAHATDASAYVQLARAFIAHKRATADVGLMAYAKDAIDAALTLQPAHREARHLQIVASMDSHRFQRAADRARALLAADGGDVTAHLLLSDALLEMGDYDGAVDALQEAMDRYPDLRVHGRTAYLRWLHNDVEGALESLADALGAGSREAEPRAWCYSELGLVHWHRGDLDKAGVAVQRALDLVPDYAPALLVRARIAAARERFDDAIELLEGVVARRPEAQELLLLAEFAGRSGRTEAAGEYLARAEKLAQHDPAPVALYHARHRLDAKQALAWAEAAVRERATVYTLDVHAVALARAGRAEDARAAMARALALDTPDASLHLHRALVELEAGDPAAAAAALQRARSINPHADPILRSELQTRLAGGQEKP